MKRNAIQFLCAIIFIGFSSSCTQPGQSTKVGAVGGGAIGAGLGAIIGSQTGDAGAGLAIGAIAGAGTGAAIGNAFDRQDASIRTQDEAIARQEQLLRAQKKEIGDLREMSQDSPRREVVARKSRSVTRVDSNTAVPRAALKEYPYGKPSKSNVVRVPAGPLKLPAHMAAKRSPRVNIQANNSVRKSPPVRAAQYNPSRSDQVDTYEKRKRRLQESSRPEMPIKERDIRTVGTLQPTFLDAKNDSMNPEFEGEIMAENEESDFVVINQNDSLEAVSDNTLEVEPERIAKPAFEEIDDNEIIRMRGDARVQELSPVVDSEECLNAAKEVQAAKVATDMADKLFYYRRALRLCPESSAYHVGMGELYLSLDRKEDARFEFQEALKINPAEVTAMKGLKDLSTTVTANNSDSSGSTDIGERY